MCVCVCVCVGVCPSIGLSRATFGKYAVTSRLRVKVALKLGHRGTLKQT